MKYIRKFSSIQEMQAAIAADEVGFIGMVHPEGEDPTMNIHVHEIIYPYDLLISCTNNIVTISAKPVGEVTIEYRLNYEGEYVTYTEPFAITETVIVNARAMTEDDSINRNQQCEYVTLPTNLAITCENNTVTITADNATTIEYNFDGSSTYTTYTHPFAITQTVTVYAKASNSGGSITGSQECEYINPIDYSIPFYIEDISGSENTVKIKKLNSSAPTLSIQKSTDGTTWTSMGETSTTALEATVPANGKLYLRCSTSAWGSSSTYNSINTTGNFSVGGNIMSLLYGSNFTGEEITFPSGSTYNFRSLFYSSSYLVNASDLLLPATTLTQYCYQYMFGFSGLTTPPELPATTLAEGCYKDMFTNCRRFTTAPALPATTLAQECYNGMFTGAPLTTAPALPATTLANGCYQYMFYACSALTTAPALPATTLADHCYYEMFRNCTSLTTAPALPATTLANHCYQQMFYGCTPLTTAPTLPATTLATECYREMFSGCTNLNYIECLATDISASNCTTNWVQNVASSGTFVKDPNMSDWTIDNNGIPTNWVVKNPSGIELTQSLNVATIEMSELDEGTGYYTINGGSHIALSEGTTTIPITQAMDGQTLLAYGEFDGESQQKMLTIKYYSANEIPFYIENVSGSTNTVQIVKSYSSAPTLTIEKSSDGTTWTSMGTTSTTAITATIPTNSKLYLRCSATTWCTSSNYNRINTTGNCNIGGNTMSLLYGSSFTGNETTFPSGSTYTFYNLFNGNIHLVDVCNLLLPATALTYRCYTNMFQGCTALTTAPALPATTLADECYTTMFSGCTTLTTAPALPATTLAQSCYNNMFNRCTLLTTAPELPATDLADGCYGGMFGYCTSLATAPALPATTLTYNCYSSMFSGCTSLTTAPALPATTLTGYCYQYMFLGCSALTTAPELPATTLANHCYQQMFKDCTNLNYIKCLATNISANNCTTSWVSGVAATGTFVKDPSMSGWTIGSNGIPTNWVVRNPSGIELTQSLNVATIEMTELDEGTGYYTINSGSQVSIGEGTTTIPITQAMDGQTLLVYGEFDGEASQETMTLDWVDYSPTITITESNNYVTIASDTADTIQYRLGSTGEYTNYTTPVYINEDTTIYVTATRTVSGVDYTSTASQEVEHVLIPPTNLTISCTNNFVTITADNAPTLEYNLDGGSTYTTFTQPFFISQSGTVYAKATNSDGSITKSQAVTYVDYRPTITITESNNYVTINAPNANTTQYRLGSTGEYTNYTEPVYIASDTTIYVTATRTVSGVDYTSTASQEVQHVLIPPTNLVISCSNNKVTITATNATTIEYNTDGSSTYTTYTVPFAITQTVTVYAKATNADGSITASQECEYQSGPDVPFAENLRFYAPLTQGDLTDHKSGITGSTDTKEVTGTSNYYATCTWDSSVGAYQMACYGRSGYNDFSSALYFDNLTLFTGTGTDNITNSGITLFMQIREVSYGGNHYGFWFIVDDGHVAWSNYQHATGSVASGGYLSPGTCYLAIRGYPYGYGAQGSFHKCVFTVTSSGSVTWYLDGVSKATGNWGQNIKGNPTSCAVLQQQAGTTSQVAYVKDLRIYNRCLSASEVAQL